MIRAARVGLAAASLIGSLLIGDLLVARLVPRVRVYSELLTGEPYPAAASDYLPLTTPSGVTFRHRVEGREIEYRFNRWGYRGPRPIDPARPALEKRLLVVGDSFVLGWGNPLADTFVDRLRRELEPRGYEVINAGYRGGYSPDGYYAYLLREGLALAPQTVVVALYPANDLADVRHNVWRRTDELGAPLELGTIRLYMDHNGRVLHPPDRLREILPWGYRVPIARRSHLFAAASQALDRGLGRNRLPAAEAERRLALVASALERRLAERSVDLFFLLIPADPRRASDAERDAFERVRRALPEGARVIDLSPRLDGSAFFDHDAHFNRRGNRIAYEALLERLAADDRGATGS